MTIARCEGAFTAPGPSAPVLLLGAFNVTVAGDFAGCLRLERSFDAGASWHPLARDLSGALVSFTAPLSVASREWERGVLYRLRCVSLRRGRVLYRISQ